MNCKHCDAALVTAPEFVQGDWVLREPTEARKGYADDAAVNETLQRGLLVKVGKFEGVWALVVHKGTEVGWVKHESLLEIKY